MDDTVRKAIMESHEETAPWVEQYKSWMNGEFALVRTRYEKAQSSWTHRGGWANCYHYHGYHDFLLNDDWKRVGLYWQITMRFEHFRERRFVVHLVWEGQQKKTPDHLRTELVSQCAKMGTPLNVASGGLGTGNSILTHTVSYSGNSFANAATGVVTKLHVFDPAINAALVELGV